MLKVRQAIRLRRNLALRAAVLPMSVSNVLDGRGASGRRGGHDHRSGDQAVNRLLDLPDWPNAIFANGEGLADGAPMIASMRRPRVPDDLAVAGFDDSSIARRVWPPITSVRRPVGAMAAIAVEQLVRDRYEGDAAIVALYADDEIIRWASTGDWPRGACRQRSGQPLR